MPSRCERIAIRTKASIELPLSEVDQLTVDIVVLLHPMQQRTLDFGRRAIVERITLGNEDSQCAAEIPKLPNRVVVVAARGNCR